MALDATVGGASSNSYVTQAEADTYFAAGMHEKNATWTALSSNGKDEYLIKATRQIDMQRINGPKNDTSTTSGAPDQRLKFPRSEDVDGSTEFIPLPVKLATYEQAIHLAEVGSGSDMRSKLQAQGVVAVSVGDVSETYADAKAARNPLNILAPEARQLLMAGGFIRITGTFS